MCMQNNGRDGDNNAEGPEFQPGPEAKGGVNVSLGPLGKEVISGEALLYKYYK